MNVKGIKQAILVYIEESIHVIMQHIFFSQELIKIGFLGTFDIKYTKMDYILSFFVASIVRYANMMTTDMLRKYDTCIFHFTTVGL